MKKYWWVGLLIVLTIIALWWFWPKEKKIFLSPEGQWTFESKPLEKYSFPKLRERVFTPDGIWVEEGSNFYYWVDGKKISGQIHQPREQAPEGGWPVVIMIRGYVDREAYQPGVGTR